MKLSGWPISQMANPDNTLYLRGACTLSRRCRNRRYFGIAVLNQPKESAYTAKTTLMGGDNCLSVIGKKNFLSGL
jgi:hypothetical protein